MLHFFKKSGRSNTNREDKTLVIQQDVCQRQISSSNAQSCTDIECLDETLAEFHPANDERRSRLSKNIHEILTDKNCLSYFIQFLETKNALSPLKFYLDSESFQIAVETLISRSSSSAAAVEAASMTKESQLKYSNCDNVNEEQKLTKKKVTKSVSSEGYDSLSLNSYDISDRLSNSSHHMDDIPRTLATTPSISYDLSMDKECNKSNCDNVDQLSNSCQISMEKPLTDDEKSQLRDDIDKRNDIFEDRYIRSTNCITSSDRDSSQSVPDKSVVSDAIRIYRKYLVTSSPSFISVPSSIIANISLELCAPGCDGQSISPVSSNCFEEAQNYVLEELERKYLNEFLESEFYCKYCVNVLTSGGLSVTDVLYSESALFYFMEYLEQEGKRNYLDFWMTATNFREHYKYRLNHSFSKTEAQNDAMVLYDKYFSLQASCPLNVSDNVRSHIEERICADDKAMIYCFDLPLRIIEGYFNKYLFSSFLTSPLFEKYLSELNVKLEVNPCSDTSTIKVTSRRRHQKSLSDCTNKNTTDLRNNVSTHQNNTTLAIDTNRLNSSVTNLQKSDMQIDFRQLTNPDLLWHREKSSKNSLTFGRVDSLGRYERDFEPSSSSADDKWSLAAGGHRLKNAVRRLVKLPEDHLQEEIAWQVAEMIVKDVTDVTLANDDTIPID